MNLNLSTQSKLCALLVPTVLIAACASDPVPQPASAHASMMHLYGSLKDDWNRHDSAAIASHFTKDGTYGSPATGGPLSGGAIPAFTGALFTAIPDFHVDVVSVNAVSDSTLAERWVIKGTWTQSFPEGPLKGVPATGKSFQLPGAGFIDIRDGKILSDTAYFDQMAFLTQLGLIGQK